MEETTIGANILLTEAARTWMYLEALEKIYLLVEELGLSTPFKLFFNMIIFSYCEKSTYLGFQIWQNFIGEFQVSQNFSMFRDFLERASMRKGWETLFFISSSFCMIIIIFLI